MTPEQIAKNGSEHSEQAALLCWAALAANGQISLTGDSEVRDDWRARKLKLLFAINNATGQDNVRHGARNKAEGVKSGVPDLLLPVARILQEAPHMAYSHGLFIEMKRRDAYREGKPLQGTSDKQKEWIAALQAENYAAAVCYGWEHARDTILAYLS